MASSSRLVGPAYFHRVELIGNNKFLLSPAVEAMPQELKSAAQRIPTLH